MGVIHMSAVKKKVHKSALALIPPKSVWGPIQEIRKVHDKSYVQWMPHINILYPFAEDSEFADLKPKAIEALKSIQPFDVEFNEFKYFQHGKKSSTLWLHPQESGKDSKSLQDIEQALLKTFPSCTDLVDRGGFVPHLSVGQFKAQPHVESFKEKFQGSWTPVKFTVNCLYFISRTDSDPFEVRCVIPLGGASVVSEFQENPITTISLPDNYFKLFVGGISQTVSKEDLKSHFSSVCTVLDVVIPYDTKTKQQKGFGFVTAVDNSVDKVINSLHNSTLGGKRISVKEAK